jgi:hypothetical protein
VATVNGWLWEVGGRSEHRLVVDCGRQLLVAPVDFHVDAASVPPLELVTQQHPRAPMVEMDRDRVDLPAHHRDPVPREVDRRHAPFAVAPLSTQTTVGSVQKINSTVSCVVDGS